MVSGGVISDRGPKDELFPKILANTQAGCTYMNEEVNG